MSARSWLVALLLAASPGAFAIDMVSNPDLAPAPAVQAT
jgi:hypothetical protein